MLTKSGFMVGLGETQDELFDVMRDLRAHGCDIVTIGQYLRPTSSTCRSSATTTRRSTQAFVELRRASSASRTSRPGRSSARRTTPRSSRALGPARGTDASSRWSEVPHG